jgi:hypothetical protein
LLLLLAVLATGCKKDELDDFHTEVGPQFPTFLGNALNTATKYATGETVTFELQFAPQTDPIKQVVILQKVEPSRDSVAVQTIPYAPAYSRIKRADTLVVRYTVPAGANKALVRVDARVESTNGQSKTRTFFYRLAEANPTIAINSGPTNVTVPAGASPAPGDIVRYNVTINAGGITTAPIPPSTAAVPAGTLYKDVDSLLVFARIGTGPERRVVRIKPAASGAQLTQNVDVPLPAGSAGQPVTLRFEVKVRTPARSASATAAAPITPVAPTPFNATVRTATLAYTGTTGGDLAAYDLTTFAAVAAAGPATSKDLVISSTATNQVQLRTLSTNTRLVRSTTAIYNAATLTSIRQTYNATAAASQVTTLDNVVVGDVIITKLRGLDQYAAMQVASISRTSATDVTVGLNIKAL